MNKYDHNLAKMDLTIGLVDLLEKVKKHMVMATANQQGEAILELNYVQKNLEVIAEMLSYTDDEDVPHETYSRNN